MSHLRRIIILPAAAAFVLFVAAACGGSGGVPSNAVAVVGEQTVTKAELDRLLSQARTNSRSTNRPFPKPRTAQYVQIRDQIVQFLVRRAQLAQEADERGIEISEEQVEQRRNQLVQQYFGGNEKEYEKQLKANGVTDEQTRADIKASLIQEALLKDVSKDVKASDAELRKYYGANKQQYAKPIRRDIRHILLRRDQQTLAGSLATQLRRGADFAQLARRYSQDLESKKAGGRLEISKGQGGETLDKVVFSIATHKISDPIRTRFGWHVIEALGPVQPARTAPYKQVKAAVREEVLQRKRNEASSKYLERLARSEDVKYQTGFGPRQ